MNQKILAIDDCRINVLLLKHILTRANIQVDSASNGEEGLLLAGKHPYPLIFVDIMMPGIDGFETCRRLRALPGEHRPHLILLTAMGEEFSANRAVDAGADEFLFKPIVPSQILDVALRAIEKTPAPPDPA